MVPGASGRTPGSLSFAAKVAELAARYMAYSGDPFARSVTQRAISSRSASLYAPKRCSQCLRVWESVPSGPAPPERWEACRATCSS